MNIAFDNWIPVVTAAGERRMASVCQVLAEGKQFADLAVRPHERVAVMRLLLCVAHAALDGPKDYDDWREVPARLPEAAREYLERWRDSFELFDAKKPWLQVAGLSTGSSKQTSTSKLSFSYATGNNTTLFDHGGMIEVRQMADSELALAVLTYQCFSPGGLISQVFWGDTQTTKSSKDAPCVPASMIHTLLRGGSLFESIHLNLPSREDIRFSYGETELGSPLWECLPESPDDVPSIKNATETYLGRLVPLARFIWLESNGESMLLGSGLEYPTFTDGFPQEPTATVVVRNTAKQQERTVLSFRPSRALWRELAAIMVKRTAEGTGGPLSLRAIRDGGKCDVIVDAVARDQANILDSVESVFSVPAQLSTPAGVSAYEAEVKFTETISSRLARAVEKYRETIDGGWDGRLKNAGAKKGELKAKLHAAATTHYWTAVEKNLPLLMSYVEALGTDTDVVESTRDAWRKTVFAYACDAFRTACGQETPRQIRAFAAGWKQLVKPKDETASEKKESKP